jgi:hypothetical protein
VALPTGQASRTDPMSSISPGRSSPPRAANQALETLAPLRTLICPREGDLYRRTRPQYLQELRFREALEALADLADVHHDTALAGTPNVTDFDRD